MKRKDEGAFTVNVIVYSIREKLNQAGKSIKITLFLHYFSLSDPDFDDVEDDGTFGSLFSKKSSLLPQVLSLFPQQRDIERARS